MRYIKILLCYLTFITSSFADHISSVSLECAVEKYTNFNKQSEVAIMQRDTKVGDKFWITSVKRDLSEIYLSQNTEGHVKNAYSGYFEVSIVYGFSTCDYIYVLEDEDQFWGHCEGLINFADPQSYEVLLSINRSSGLFEINQYQNGKAAFSTEGVCNRKSKDL